MHDSKVNGMEMKYLRRTVGKTKWNEIANEGIKDMLQSIVREIRKRKLWWSGHIIIVYPEELMRKVYEMRSKRKKRKGKPRTTWLQQIEELGRASKRKNKFDKEGLKNLIN